MTIGADRLRLATLFSGGKDSVYAIYLAQQYGWEVVQTVVMVPEQEGAHLFHVPNIGLAPVVSRALGIGPMVFSTGGEEEQELEDLEHALGIIECDGVLTGALASDYQWSRINRVCHRLGLRTYSPLWRKDQRRVVEEEIAAGFEILFSGVAAEGLGQEWLGRRLDADALCALSKVRGLNLAGEGGEFETIVLDGPNFKRRVALEGCAPRWNRRSGVLHVDSASLRSKRS
ncbi:MAG: diphthine--ammonia ligase [Candidatus Thermoplasmatota archaeon]